MSVNLGRVAYVEKGAYDSGTTYESKDVVSFNGGSYVFIGDTPAANVPPTDESTWQPLIDPTAMNEKIAELDGVKQEALAAAATASEKAQEAATAASTANTAAEAADNARLAILDELNKKAPAIFVDASGDMVHITDGAEGMPVASLITHVEPKQEGSGDPSPDNVRPIIGWDEVSVTGAGKNLFDPLNVKERTVYGVTASRNEDGSIHLSGTPVRGLHYIKPDDNVFLCLPAGTYYLTPDNFELQRPGEKYKGVFTLTKETEFKNGAIYFSNTEGTLDINVYIQLECGSTATDYEPYTTKSLTAELPETVYGGEMNWTTGVLTIDPPRIFTGDEEWASLVNGSEKRQWHLYLYDNADSHIVCNRYKSIGISERWHEGNNNSCYLGTGAVCVRADGFATVTEWKQYLRDLYAAGTPLQVWYKNSNPTKTQLTPQQLSTLKGVNNIWSDAGQTAVTYAADTKMYIDQKIAAIAAAIV